MQQIIAMIKEDFDDFNHFKPGISGDADGGDG
jgi:hypothetical protein